MQNRNYKGILYFISLVILATLGIQLYWNYKNYQSGKQQLLNEVQSSLDNAIDSYYIDIAERNTVGFSLKNGGNITNNPELDSIFKRIDASGEILQVDSLKKAFPEFKFFTRAQITMSDTIITSEGKTENKTKQDSLNEIFKLVSQVIVSITTDTLEIQSLNRHIEDQLRQKNFNIDYGYIFKKDSVEIQKYNPDLAVQDVLITISKSAYLPKESTFKFFFTNETATILKRNLLGIFLSAILVASVVGCLFFLLRIINRQKQLSELKNDLINNITHEFKTPISTVKVALEGIENFNQKNDPTKTKGYLQVSNNQLDKLEGMVEKLLETAALDGGKLQLKKKEVPVVRMLEDLVEKHRNLAPHKTFDFSAEQKNVMIMADAFHLENSINNILDNAVKYGGDKIDIAISSDNGLMKIAINDNGKDLTKAQAEQIFEKFYRVPKGNTHDIKGFGIGLYYTKNIIEKHGGNITVNLNRKTCFHITLPRDA